MFARIRLWQASGLSQKAFCHTHHISFGVFQYWLRKFKATHAQQAAGFVQLQVPPASGEPFAELHLASGTRITFHQPVASDYLKSLL